MLNYGIRCPSAKKGPLPSDTFNTGPSKDGVNARRHTMTRVESSGARTELNRYDNTS